MYTLTAPIAACLEATPTSNLLVGLVNDWEFNGDLTDRVGGAAMTPVNSPGYVPGLFGQLALHLTKASSQYCTIPTGILLSLSTAWSASVWVTPTSTGIGSNDTWIFTFGTGTSNYLGLFFRGGNGASGLDIQGQTPMFGVHLTSPGFENDANAPYALTANVPNHVAVVCDGTRCSLFINGNCVGSIPQGATNQYDNFAPSQLGNTTINKLGWSQFADPYSDSSYQQLLIYNRALLPQEVSQLYNGGLGCPYPFANLPPVVFPVNHGRLKFALSVFSNAANVLNFYESNDAVFWNAFAVNYTPQSPYVVRDSCFGYVNGVAWLIHTANSYNGTAFGVAQATDMALVNWNWVGIADMSVLGSGANNAIWAPSFAMNADGTVYVDATLTTSQGFSTPIVFFAFAANASVPASAGFQIYWTYPTNSTWTTWAVPVAVTGTALLANMIDARVVRNTALSAWVMYYKDETNNVLNYMYSTTAYATGYNTASGSNPMGFSTSPAFEGPGYMVAPTSGKLRIFGDAYSSEDGFWYAESTNGTTGWTKICGFSAAAILRHGTVCATQ